MKKSIEPMWWALFSAGGVMAALFIPVLILVIGFVIPFDMVDESVYSYERMHEIVSHPIMKIILLAVIALPFFHFAHRFYFTVIHTGLWKNKPVLAFFSYGGAIAGTILAMFLLWRV